MMSRSSSFCGPRIQILLFLSFFFVTSFAVESVSKTIPRNRDGNLTVAVNVPEASDDELFFHILAPAEQSWIAWGFGSEMKNALMFIAYPSEDGQNVTVSPRVGTGHQEPKHTDDVKVEVLGGTFVNDDAYSIEMKCTGCRSWPLASGGQGEVDVESSDASMIFAIGDTGEIQSDDKEERITKHTAEGSFKLDLSSAIGEAGVPRTDGADLASVQTSTYAHAVPLFHGFLMTACFAVLLPIGALLIRLQFRFAFWLHLVWQSFTLLAILVGFALGVFITTKQSDPPSFKSAHQGLGFAVLIIVLVQPVLGFLHHRKYKQTQSPTLIGTVHKYLGPSIILLAIINGALGLDLADRKSALFAYFGFVICISIAILLVAWLLRRKALHQKAMNSAAANNFREGQTAERGSGPTPMFGHTDVPLENVGPGHRNLSHRPNANGSQQSFSQAEHAPPNYVNVMPKNDGQRML